MITEHVENTIEVKLYLGSRIGYHGKEFTEDELVEVIGEFQGEHDNYSPVRVTKTRFVDKHYNEHGWELAVVNYPMKPQTRNQLILFMKQLGYQLLEKFNQKRITLLTKKKTTVLQKET